MLLLRFPATRVVYVTSGPVERTIVDYYLALLPAAARTDARRRLTMLCCHDGSREPLTAKLLARPELVARLRAITGDPAAAHLTCFNVTPLERTLAVRLGIPIYGCDPALAPLGTKSGSRDVFHAAEVSAPPGYGHLRGVDDIADALASLKREHPSLGAAVVKLEEGFSGEGNAIFGYGGAPPRATQPALARWVRGELARRLRFAAPGETWERYAAAFERMGGIVEAFVGDPASGRSRSPSVQCRIDPLGGIQVVSTHDQLLGGATGQVFLGCTFPAQPGGRAAIHEAGRRVATLLAHRGVVGRFGIDFMVTRDVDGWRCQAIEINLRKGGTTHPYLTLQHLTDGSYDTGTGQFTTAGGAPCHYVASDNLVHPAYANLTPDALLDATTRARLDWDPQRERGVIFHLLGALPTHGKVGALAIGRTATEARTLYDRAVALLDHESGRLHASSSRRDVTPATDRVARSLPDHATPLAVRP